jgi:hypothetical protein
MQFTPERDVRNTTFRTMNGTRLTGKAKRRA